MLMLEVWVRNPEDVSLPELESVESTSSAARPPFLPPVPLPESSVVFFLLFPACEALFCAALPLGPAVLFLPLCAVRAMMSEWARDPR